MLLPENRRVEGIAGLLHFDQHAVAGGDLVRPGLLVVNNGPFGEKDFRAITEVARGQKLAGRRPKEQEGALSFETPAAWRRGISIDRERKGRRAEVRLLGVGHRLFDIGLREALDLEEAVTVLRNWDSPVLVFKVR